MSIISSEVKYNPIASEFSLSGEMSNITLTALPDTPIAKQWITEPCFLPKRFELSGNRILDFEVRPDDVWVISYPKAGTTWAQEMIWMLCNDLDYSSATRNITDRFYFFEQETMYALRSEKAIESITKVHQAPSPRFIKSHLPIHLLPRQLWSIKPKIVYVARNPKDVAISYFHHLTNLQGCKATFEECLEAFLSDQLFCSPFHSHVLNFWRTRNEDFVHFVMYEDMKANLKGELERISKFFGKKFSNEELCALEHHLSFDAMRGNKAVNFEEHKEVVRRRLSEDIPNPDYEFMRKGKSGGFATDMPPETIARFDAWTTEKCIETDFKYAM